MARRNRTQKRRQNAGQYGTPAQLLDSRLTLRVQEERATPASRIINGTARYTDPLKSGTPRQLQPKYGLFFNGSSEYAFASFTPPAGDLYVSGWFRVNTPPVTTGRAIISKWNGTGNQRSFLVEIAATTGYLTAYQSPDGTSVATRTVQTNVCDGSWHHVAVKFDATGGFPAIYLDGAAATMTGTGTAAGNLFNSSAPLEVARYNQDNARCLGGTVDEIRVVSLLSASDIAALAAMKPGSTSGVTVSAVPLIHYKCEDPVTSPIVRNSGSLGSAADATITGTIANVRGTVSPVFCWANEVGGNHAYVTDGVNDYLDSQINLRSATAFTVWKRSRYLSTSGFDFEGFYYDAGGITPVRFGRNNGTTEFYANLGDSNVDTFGNIPNGVLHTMAISSLVGGNEKVYRDGVLIKDAAASFTGVSGTQNITFKIGAQESSSGGVSHYSHCEYYEYLIADRQLTDDELTWLETRGASGTAIDFANDPNILLYTDFQEQTPTQITNLANPNLPILKAVGGEMTMVPRDESNTGYDVNGKALQYVGQCPRDMVLTSPAVTLNGTSEYITLPVTLAGATSWEFECKFKTSDTSAHIFENRDADNDGVAIAISSGTIRVQSDATDVSTVATFSDDAWHSLRAVWDGANITIYVDGIAYASGAMPAASAIARTDSLIGANYVGANFAGTVADIQITIDGSVVGTWPLTEPFGDIAFDISGNGNDGKLTGTIANMRAGTQNKSDVLVKSGYSVGRWYDGANDGYSRPKLVAGANRLCISCYVQLDAATSSDFLVSESNFVGDQRSWGLYFSGSKKLIFFASEDGLAPTNATSLTSLQDGVLYHILVTYDAGTVAFEVNGDDDTDASVTDASAWSGSTADFIIGGLAASNYYAGTISQLLIHKDPTAVWSTATKAAIRAAGKPSEIQAIVSGLGGTAWYFPYGDGSYEALQSLPALTHNGASEQRIIPVGAAGIQPTHGPGLLAPGQSLDLYCGQDDAPVCQVLAGDLSDGTYDFGDGDEANVLFKRGDANSEELAVITPAASGSEFAVLQNWST